MNPQQHFNYVNRTGHEPPKEGVKKYALFEGDRQVSGIEPYPVLKTLMKNKIKAGCKAHYLKIKPVNK